VQEHTLKGLDGLAPAGTVKPLQGRSWDPPNADVEPRLGVLMNPYIPSSAPSGTVRQLFVSEPFSDTIAVINLVVFGTAPNQVFGLSMVNPVSRIASTALNLPVDLAPARRDNDNVNWASNSTLDQGSDIYVANRGNNTIVRMRQDGTVVLIVGVTVNGSPLDGILNGVAVSPDGNSIYVTFIGPGADQGGVLALPAFGH
jgi:DNA-binding beta-propeller fold protein YncE